jgi:hypothetical protein
MDQHPFARADARDTKQHVIGGEVVDRQRRRLLEGGPIGQLDRLLGGHAHHVGVGAEADQHRHPLADARSGHSRSEGVHDAGRFVADHARRLGRVGVEALAGHHLREIQADGVDTNTDLARAGLGIGRLPDLQYLRPTMPGDPDRSHAALRSPEQTRPGWQSTRRVSPMLRAPLHA